MEEVRVDNCVPCRSSGHGLALLILALLIFYFFIGLWSVCKMVASCWILMLRYRMYSSAKRRIVVLMASSGRSFMYIKNSMGPINMTLLQLKV